MNEQLKPCPFCGCDAKTIVDAKLIGKSEHRVYVACGNRDCIMTRDFGGFTPEQWNTRPTEFRLEGQLEEAHRGKDKRSDYVLSEQDWISYWKGRAEKAEAALTLARAHADRMANVIQGSVKALSHDEWCDVPDGLCTCGLDEVLPEMQAVILQHEAMKEREG